MREVLQQLLALATFFTFPVFRYLLLKRYARRQGDPELWYLPAHGFRLVVRNIGGKRTLSDIKYRAVMRDVVPAGAGASVATWNDRTLLTREDFFLFPGSDQILLSFRLERNEAGFILIYKNLRKEVEEQQQEIYEQSMLIADYTANIESTFNFDIRVSRRIEISGKILTAAYAETKINNIEQRFPVTRIRDVG